MKKSIILTFIAIIATACSAILIIGTQANSQKQKAGSETNTTGYLYTVKSYEGKIAVFDFGTNTPLEILECPLSSLPTEETEMLKIGINVATESELQQLIEAFD